jgi:hypothetical protein
MLKTKIKKVLLNKYFIISVLAVLIASSYYCYKHVTSEEYKLFKQVKTVSKSYMKFHFDIVGHLPYYDQYYMDLSYLKENKNLTFEKWNGPYTKLLVNDKSLVLPGYSNINILYLKSDINLGDKVPLSEDMRCDKTDDCKLWFELTGIDKNLSALVDEYIDDKPSANQGKIRYLEDSLYVLFIKNYQTGVKAKND